MARLVLWAPIEVMTKFVVAILLLGLVAACAPHPCKEGEVGRLKCDPSVDFTSAAPVSSVGW